MLKLPFMGPHKQKHIKKRPRGKNEPRVALDFNASHAPRGHSMLSTKRKLKERVGGAEGVEEVEKSLVVEGNWAWGGAWTAGTPTQPARTTTAMAVRLDA